MITVLPYELISRNEESLLISYLSSVELTHEGMKNVLYMLHQSRGSLSDDELIKLLLKNNIDPEKGEEFLVSSGVIKRSNTEHQQLWDEVLIITDSPDVFSHSKEDWRKDSIIITNIFDTTSIPDKIPENSLAWIHLENYLPDLIRNIYNQYTTISNVAFVQSYYLKEIFRIDGVYSPELGTPCHFCHINRWVNREEKSLGRNEMSWANLLSLLYTSNSGLPAISLSESERGFSGHLIKRRLQELIGTALVKLHADSLMASVSTDLITCTLNREPVIHWHACDCIGQ